MNRFYPDYSYNKHKEKPNASKIPHCNAVTSQILLQDPCRLGTETDKVKKTNSTHPEEDQF